MKREQFIGASDLDRPLTPEGRKKARRAFQGFALIYGPPDRILHSRAVRARDTALMLAQVAAAPLSETALLDPGADYKSLVSLLQEPAAQVGRLALVGHEPDFSEMISGLLPADRGGRPGFLHLDIKKASCVEVKLDRAGAGELISMLTPKMLRRLAR